MKNPTFCQLVEEHTRGRVAKGQKPITIVSLCDKCKVSRPSFYNMLTGNAGVSIKIIEKVAKGMGAPIAEIKAAVDKSRAIAEMSS